MKRVRAAAEGHSNIEVLGYQSDNCYKHIISKAKAFVLAAIEDFGISTVEAQADGTPVICLARGGSLEIVQGLYSDVPTGVYFREQTEDSLIRAVDEFEASVYRILPANCRRNAERFSAERFSSTLKQVVERALAERGETPVRGTVHVLPQPVLVKPVIERAAG